MLPYTQQPKILIKMVNALMIKVSLGMEVTSKRMKLGEVKELISRAPKQNFSCPIKAYHREHLCI